MMCCCSSFFIGSVMNIFEDLIEENEHLREYKERTTTTHHFLFSYISYMICRYYKYKRIFVATQKIKILLSY